MNNTQTDQGVVGDQNVQASAPQLDDLLDEAKKINEEIEKDTRELKEEMDGIEAEVDASVKKIDQACADLDEADQEVADELDKLALEQAEDLAAE